MLGYDFAWPFKMYAVSIYVLCFGVSTGEYSVAHYFMGNLLHCIFTIVVVAVWAIVYSFLLLPIFVAISQHEANIRLMTK